HRSQSVPALSLPVPPSVSISLVPSSSQPGPGRLLCSVLDFYPAPIQVRWFQGQQELSEHVVATEVVPNGDWSYQLLVLCQVEHGSLEHPLSQSWGTGKGLVLIAIEFGGAGNDWGGI
uniref:Ig-like domain-containing protein n=1 Tax=Taeniopygia guttata TaxID=59729 RepID=A0A674G8F0_TAEGU